MLGYGKHRGVRVHKRTQGPWSGYQILPELVQTPLHYACLLLASSLTRCPPPSENWLLLFSLQNPDLSSLLSPRAYLFCPAAPSMSPHHISTGNTLFKLRGHLFAAGLSI